MKPRDRIRHVMDLAGNPPDKIPYDGLIPWRSDIFTMLQKTPSSWQPPEDIYPNVPLPFIKLKIYKWKPRWDVPRKWQELRRVAMDEWGCYWNYTGNDPTKGHPGKPAFDTWDDLESWNPPDGSDPARYQFFGKASRLFPRKYKVAMLDSFLFSRCQYLRGFTQILIDFHRHANKVHELIARIVPFYIDAIDAWMKYGPDAVFCMDDMGTQTGLFMSPSLYDKFFKEPFRQIVDHAREKGLKFVLHSCGKVNELVDTWLDIGVDAFQFDGPHQTGIEEMAKYAGKVCFWDVPDIQRVYPIAAPGEIEREVKFMIDHLATEHGGLILRDYLGARSVLNVPKENIKAYRRAVKKHGKYPLDS
ncbi:hypothetical protein GF325_02615 [Candidatus Bathyarchaeota archaeon]|nr:hypothetical protein [Candidatus Bathyarchaeota archaeon]